MKKKLLITATALLVLAGLQCAKAQSGASLHFDGANDYANLGSAITSSLSGGTKVTVEAWVKPTSLSGLGCIVGNYNTGASALQVLLRRGNNQYYEFWVGTGGTWYQTNSVATPTLNVWQHVAASWDGTVASVYVNGVLSGTTTPPMSTLGNASGSPMWIGGNTINESFAGEIDEVRIWNIVRTESQIQSYMNCQVPTATPGLLAGYNFNEGVPNGTNTSLSTANDVTGNGNAGTLIGFGLSGATSNFTADVRTDYFGLQSSIGSTSMNDRLGNGHAIDYNNDGWKDVMVTSENQETRLYLNNGRGNFSNYSVIHPAGSGYVRAVADLDNDGDRDYVTTKTGTVTAYINNGNGTFNTYPTNLLNGTGDMIGVKIADVNGDGKADLVLANNNTGSTNKNEIWVNTGTTGVPAFSFLVDFVNTIGSNSIATGDVDEDGDVDIVFGAYGNVGVLYLNNANNGTFNVGITPSGYTGGADLVDFNKDGHLDFINYEQYNRSLMIRYGYGNGLFSTLQFLLTNSVINMGQLMDINGDGFLDFVASNWGGTGLVYLNNGCSFTLQNSCNYNLGRADNAVTLADFNNDGSPDVFCQARDNKSSFYLNYLTAVSTPSLSHITSSPGVVTCNGTTATLSATASASGAVEWYNLSTGGSPLVSSSNYTLNMSAGTYTYYTGALNANNCRSAIRTPVVLTVNASPSIMVPNGAICSGSSFTLAPTGAVTYTYSSGSAVVSPTTQTSYSVTGTGSNGCVSLTPAVSTVSVNVCTPAAALNFDGVDDFVDGGIGVTNALKGKDKLTVEAWVYPTQNTAGASIIGNHQSNTQFNVQQTTANQFNFFIGFGTYGVTTASNSVVLNTWQHIAGVFDDNVLKFYINGVLSGTTAVPSSYVLNMSCNTNMWIGKSAFVEFFQGNVDEVRVWDVARTQCEINTYKNCEIPTTASGLLANYHFNQGVVGGSNATETMLMDASGSAFTGTLTNMALTGTTSNWVAPGAVVSGSVTPATLVVGAAVTNSAVCAGNSTTLNGTGADTYVWTDGVINGSVFTPTVTHTYTVTGTNTLTTCSNTAVASVTVNTLPVISVSSGSICAGQSYTIIASGASTYSSVPFLSGPVVTPTSTTSYSITGTDANGCVTASAAVSTVVVNTLPIITVNSGSICAGQSFTMVPTGANTYTYSNGSNVVTPSSDATYSVSGTDANGCISSTSAVSSVTVNALPIIAVNSGSICAGQSFTIIPTGASTYTYSGGSDVVMPTSDASYTVTGADANGCENTTVSTVTVNALPNITATTNNTLLCTGETATLSVSGASTYTWSTTDNTANIVVSPTVQTTYTVEGSDSNGCVGSTSLTQDVSLCTGIESLNNNSGINVYPNPNNGLFVIELVTTSKVTVTNALGQVVMTETFDAGKHSVDIHNESTGVYFVQVKENNRHQTMKIVKQ
jgi:hypothetical protein